MAHITINNINIVATKSLDILSDICPICQENISTKCNKCIHNNNDIKCYSVIGICKHAYHLCCINDWSQRQSTSNLRCPMCGQKWELMKRSTH
jgi:hypothetical protein